MKLSREQMHHEETELIEKKHIYFNTKEDMTSQEIKQVKEKAKAKKERFLQLIEIYS